MAFTSAAPSQTQRVAFGAFVELLKPVTWFAPMWAYMCGAVSAGVAWSQDWPRVLLGMALAGPLVCATSQAVNDWFDRHVDAINEPHRPIPSGRLPGRSGFWIAIVWTGLSALVAALLGPIVLLAATVGLFLAWMYSAPPVRLKRSGWLGPAAVALSYEGVAWVTGAAVVLWAWPDPQIVALAALYSFGAFGIMTLNDFKALAGDRAMNLRSLPVSLGERAAAWVACGVMAVPQVVVVGLLLAWDAPLAAAFVAGSLALQTLLMGRLLRDPARLAPWYNGTGVTLYVLGMLASAIAIGAAPQ